MTTMESLLALLLLVAGFTLICFQDRIDKLQYKTESTCADTVDTEAANADLIAKEKAERQEQELESVGRPSGSWNDLAVEVLYLRRVRNELLADNKELGYSMQKLSAVKRAAKTVVVREVVVNTDPKKIAEIRKLKKEVEELKGQAKHEGHGKEKTTTLTKERDQQIETLQGQIKSLRKNMETEKAKTQHKTGTDESAIAQQLKNEQHQHAETKKSLEHLHAELKKISAELTNERQSTAVTEISAVMQLLDIEQSDHAETKGSLKHMQNTLETKSAELATEKERVIAMDAAFDKAVAAEVEEKAKVYDDILAKSIAKKTQEYDAAWDAMIEKKHAEYDAQWKELNEKKNKEYDAKLEELVHQQVGQKVEEMQKGWNKHSAVLKEEIEGECATKMADHCAALKEKIEGECATNMADHTSRARVHFGAECEEKEKEREKYWEGVTAAKFLELQEKVDDTHAFDANEITKLQDQLAQLKKTGIPQESTFQPYQPKSYQLPHYTGHNGNPSPTTPSYFHAKQPKAVPGPAFSPGYRGPLPSSPLATSAPGYSQPAYSPTSPFAKANMAGGFPPAAATTPSVPSAVGTSTGKGKEPAVGEKHPLPAEPEEEKSPKRQRGPDSQRPVLGGPIAGQKRVRDNDDDEEEIRRPEQKKAFAEEQPDLDEGLGGDWDE